MELDLRRSMYSCCLLGLVGFALPARSQPTEAPKPGIGRADLQHMMTELHPQATFHAPAMPDWMAVTPRGVWVTSSRSNAVTELVAETNRVGSSIRVAKGCSGLLYAFGSLWIPSCGDHALIRADPATGAILARIPAGPADSEGGIAADAGSVWLVTDTKGVLTRIDAATNSVSATVEIPSGSSNPLFADGSIWVTSHEHNALVKVNPATNQVSATIPVGKGPRFLAAGGGSVWTLNQGDGTVTRVDTATGRVAATIDCGIPGEGGEIAYGDNAVWATVIGFPLTRIDPSSNRVTGQWKGAGGDSIRVGHRSVWLTDLMHETVWRLAPDLR